MQQQKAEFDQRFDVIHEFDDTLTDDDGNTEVKVKLFHMDSEIDHGHKF